VVHVPGSGGTSKAWVAPVVLGGELAGRLWITDRRAAPEPFERRLIERFALVVGIELLRQRHLRDVERRLSGDLLGDLLRPGGPTHEQGILDRAAALGNDLRLPHVVAVLAPEPPQRVSRLGELVRAGVDGPALDGWYEDVHVVVLPPQAGSDGRAAAGVGAGRTGAARPGGRDGRWRLHDGRRAAHGVPRRPGRGPAAPGAPAHRGRRRP
jgi:hypothetical protein